VWQTDLHARAEKLRDAKVTDFDGAIGCDEDVLSFDVAVQDLGGVEYARARARVERVCRKALPCGCGRDAGPSGHARAPSKYTNQRTSALAAS
jgi:hypothetical protein